MKIFVISLKNSSERRKFISYQLGRLGLVFEFVDAVAGSSLGEDQISQLCDTDAIKRNPKWLSKGAIGCALSHKLAYEKIIENSYACALIIEDDMFLPENLAELLEEIAATIRKNEAVLLYFRSFHATNLSTLNSRHLTANYKIYSPLSKQEIPGTTSGYVISRSACQSLLHMILPIRVTADSWAFFVENEGIERVSVIYPRPLKDANFKSTLDYLEAYDGSLIAAFSGIVDKFKLPFAYQFLRKRRERNETRMSRVEFVDQESEFDA